MTTVHVYPLGDLIGHETDGGDCPRGPRDEPVLGEGGTCNWLTVHHSLGGRERSEVKHD